MLRRSSLLPSLLSGAVGLVGGALGAAWYISHRVTPEPRRTFIDAYTFTPWELGVPFEPISIMSSNGVTLRGWWLPQTDPKGILIGCHGHSGSKDDMLGIGSNVWRAGYSVLLFDFRGRGESDPWPQTLVSREVDDLHAAVAFAAARLPQVPIGVIGFSMGAAVAIITAAQEPRLRAVVADSAFVTGSDVVADNIRKVIGCAPPLLLRAADEVVHLRHGYRFSRARPLDHIAQIAPRPLLIIHGADDTLVPATHATRLYQAAKAPHELWIVPGVDHCGAYFIDRLAYCRRVITFLDQYLACLA